jgi:hypothetical protein
MVGDEWPSRVAYVIKNRLLVMVTAMDVIDMAESGGADSKYVLIK